MRVWSALLAFAAAGCAERVLQDVDKLENEVLRLTGDNFDRVISSNETVFVKFYATWCGHCKTMAPAWADMARQLSEKGSSVVVGHVESNDGEALMARFGVRGYPTLKLFRKGKPLDYGGPRDAASMLAFAEAMAGPAVNKVANDAAAEALLASHAAVLVGSFPNEQHEHFAVFSEAAEALRTKVPFVWMEGESALRMLRRDDGFVAAEPKWTQEGLAAFVTAEVLPFFGPIDGSTYAAYGELDNELLWFVGSSDDYAEAGAAYRKLGRGMRSTHHLVWLDTAQFKEHADKVLGVTTFPGFVAQSRKNGRFVFKSKLDLSDASAVESWLADVAAGKVERDIRSAAEPESQDGPVHVLTANSLVREMFKPDRDALLMVYAPWCKYCKQVEPILESFAAQKHPSLLVAKLHGQDNESPDPRFEWNGYPSLFFVKAGSEEVAKYDGERTLEGFTNYYKTHGTKQDAASDAAPAAHDSSEL